MLSKSTLNITLETIGELLVRVFDCQTTADFEQTTREGIIQIAQVALKEQKVEFKPKSDS